jgi:hypothetical protein
MAMIARSLPGLGLLLAALTISPAHAEPAAAKALVVDLLESVKTNPAAGTLHWGDDIDAQPSGGGDLVRVPDLRFTMPTGELRIGTVEVLVADAPPVDGHERHQLGIKWPGEISFFDQEGRMAGRFTNAENRFDGLWAPEYQRFISFDAAWKTLAYDGPQAPGTIRADSLTATQTGDEANGLLSASTTAAIAGLDIAAPTGGSVHIDEIKQTGRIDKLAIAALSEARKELGPSPPTADPKTAPFAEIARMLTTFDKVPRLGDGFSSTTRVLGIAAQTPDDKTVSLGGIAFEMSLARQEPSLAEFAFSLALDGIDTSALTLPPVIPDRAGFSIRLTALPADRLWQLAVDWTKAAENAGPENASNAVAAEAKALTHSNDTRLKLDLGFGSPSYSGVLASNLHFDAASPYSVSGDALLTVAGLDDTLKTLRELPADPNIQQAVLVLSVAKGLGAARVDKGAVVYDYAFAADSAGKVTLNGQDIQALMQKNNGNGAPPPAPGQGRGAPRNAPQHKGNAPAK